MKHTTIFLFFIIISKSTLAQINPEDTLILKRAFRGYISEEQIIYADSAKFVSEELKQMVRKGKLIGYLKKDVKDSVILTAAEQKYLLEELSQETVWPENLFADSKRMSRDSMMEYVRAENYIRRQLASQTGGMHKLIYGFIMTKPVYIRNSTIALISFFALHRRANGFSEIYLCCKENNEWKLWMTISTSHFSG